LSLGVEDGFPRLRFLFAGFKLELEAHVPLTLVGFSRGNKSIKVLFRSAMASSFETVELSRHRDLLKLPAQAIGQPAQFTQQRLQLLQEYDTNESQLEAIAEKKAIEKKVQSLEEQVARQKDSIKASKARERKLESELLVHKEHEAELEKYSNELKKELAREKKRHRHGHLASVQEEELHGAGKKRARDEAKTKGDSDAAASTGESAPKRARGEGVALADASKPLLTLFGPASTKSINITAQF
jgi:hypothetical protein